MPKKCKAPRSTAEPKSKPGPKNKKAPASSTTTTPKGETPYGKAKKAFVAKPLPKTMVGHFLWVSVNIIYFSTKYSNPQIHSFRFYSCLPHLNPRCKASDGNLKMKEIEAIWKASSERQAILVGLTASEIKPRRY